MVMVIPDPLAERICVTEILTRECLVDNAHRLRAAFIVGGELPAQKDRLSNCSEVTRGHEIVPDVVLRSRFGSGAIQRDMASRIVSGKQSHEGECRSFDLRDRVETSQ